MYYRERCGITLRRPAMQCYDCKLASSFGGWSDEVV